MTPLSWHTFGGNYDIIKLLLENGADVNADFDEKNGNTFNKITVTDVALQMIGAHSGSSLSDTYDKIFKLYVEYGGKPYNALQEDHEEL